MKAWLLVALLAQQSTATPADTATAGALLRAAISALDSAASPRFHRMLPFRYVAQLEYWSLTDEAPRAAVIFDRIEATGRPVQWHTYVSQAAQAALLNGDTVRALDVLARVPVAHREEAMARLAINLMNQRQPSPWSSWVESRLTSEWPRAQVLEARHRKALAAADTVAARDLLSRAIALAAGDTSVLRFTWSWRATRAGLGGLDDAQAVLRSALDGLDPQVHRAVLHDVASILVRQGRRDLALDVIDSLERIDAGLPDQGRELRLAQHMLLRGTAADSVAGRRLRDSIYASARARTPPTLTSGPMLVVARQLRLQVLQQQVSGNRATADTLAFLFTRLEREARAPQLLERLESRRDSLARFIPLALDASLTYLAGADVSALDSLRTLGLAALSYFDPERAGRIMASISTPRFHDRAHAVLLRRRASRDADGVALAADSLRDAVARSDVFADLAERAATAGRLSAAIRYLEQVEVPEQVVRANLAIGRALAAARRPELARERAMAALDALSPNWQCQWPACTAPDPDAIAPERIGDVLRFAIDLGMQDHVVEWAARQTGGARVAVAYLAIVEEMSRRFLGRYPNYPQVP